MREAFLAGWRDPVTRREMQVFSALAVIGAAVGAWTTLVLLERLSG